MVKKYFLKHDKDPKKISFDDLYAMGIGGYEHRKPYAGIGYRIGGFFIDAILILVLKILVPVWLIAPLFLLYVAFFTASSWQATPGQSMVGVYVTNAAGERLSLKHALWRTLLIIPSILPFFMGVLAAEFDNEKRAWHDLWAKTRVRKGYPSTGAPEDEEDF